MRNLTIAVFFLKIFQTNAVYVSAMQIEAPVGVETRIFRQNTFAMTVPDGRGGYRYFFYVKDYLGNVCSVIDDGNGLEEQTLYYPYGMPMVDMNSRSEQPYKFGGKEMDRTGGLDLYDFEARQYDSSLPGFTSADPKAQDYSELSPYALCAGNPLRYVDPTGMIITNT